MTGFKLPDNDPSSKEEYSAGGVLPTRACLIRVHGTSMMPSFWAMAPRRRRRRATRTRRKTTRARRRPPMRLQQSVKNGPS